MGTHWAILEGFGTSVPGGFTFMSGLDVKVLSDGTILPELPDGTGIQLDFSTSVGADDQFAVLYWDGSKWIEIKQNIREDKVSALVDVNAANGLYKIESADDNFCQASPQRKPAPLFW